MPETQELFFGSNDGGPLGLSGPDANNQVSKISLKGVESLKGQVEVTPVEFPFAIDQGLLLILCVVIDTSFRYHPDDERWHAVP